jgi:putative FmdB family regulatory protein
MPTYDYECYECNKVFELNHGMSDDTKKKCPACGGIKTERLISGQGEFFMKQYGRQKINE